MTNNGRTEEAQLERAVRLGALIHGLQTEVGARQDDSGHLLAEKRARLDKARLELWSMLKCSGYPT